MSAGSSSRSGMALPVPNLSTSHLPVSRPQSIASISTIAPKPNPDKQGPPVIVRRTPTPYLGKNVITNSGAAPLRCQVCQQVFVCNEYLSVHLMTHTGQLGPDDGNPVEQQAQMNLIYHPN